MIVAIICPKCKEMVTETHPHPLDQPCFICRKCQLILEPPNGVRQEILATSLVDGGTLPSRLPWEDGRSREKNWVGSEEWKKWKRVSDYRYGILDPK